VSTIEQEHAVADIAEHAVRFGTCLDLVVQPRAVDREPEHPAERTHPREVVGVEQPSPLAHGHRERTKRAPPRRHERHDDRRFRQARACLRDDSTHVDLRLRGGGPFGSLCDDPGQRPIVFEPIDDAPIDDFLHREDGGFGDRLDVVVRRREHARGLRKEVGFPSPLERAGVRRGLGGAQLSPGVVETPSLADIHQPALDAD
jgi:hypothetical protein